MNDNRLFQLSISTPPQNLMAYNNPFIGGLVAKLCLTLATLRTRARQAPLSIDFSRQECWNGLPCPPPGDLPDPGIEPRSPALRQILYRLSYEGSPPFCYPSWSLLTEFHWLVLGLFSRWVLHAVTVRSWLEAGSPAGPPGTPGLVGAPLLSI